MAGMSTLQRELARLNEMTRLSAAAADVDSIIDILSAAREQVANSLDPHTASLTMTKLQNPIKERFETVNEDLKKVSRVQKDFGKVLDKSFPLNPLPTDHDAMKDYPALINRAIAMHMLREGQFSVASTFLDEAKDNLPRTEPQTTEPRTTEPPTTEPQVTESGTAEPRTAEQATTDVNMDAREPDAPVLQSEELQVKFVDMYRILQELKARNLAPAIEWARQNSEELEARGSNLEFELSKLQYVWLFNGAGSADGVAPSPSDATSSYAGLSGRTSALAYARSHFGRFQVRHLKEIQQLASAMVYAPNLASSPYAGVFATQTAFSDVAASFTREFCSLLGLSAESPLYVAATAGALALPQLMKYVERVREKRTEWTTASELAFETPLPNSMVYHSIFVCPVSKDQTTDANPPMMLPCGHVLARESLQNLCKGTRFKCPYCPSEGQLKDARQIIL